MIHTHRKGSQTPAQQTSLTQTKTSQLIFAASKNCPSQQCAVQSNTDSALKAWQQGPRVSNPKRRIEVCKTIQQKKSQARKVETRRCKTKRTTARPRICKCGIARRNSCRGKDKCLNDVETRTANTSHYVWKRACKNGTHHWSTAHSPSW